MSEDIYRQLQQVLDTLPNGFPATENGTEIKLLKKIFEPDEAELFCDLRLTFETPEQIAQRTGRPLDGLEEKLTEMWKKGQLFGVDLGAMKVFKMMPWAFGIYEFQLNRMDREFCELCEDYMLAFGGQFFKSQPQLMQVVPVEKEIRAAHEAIPSQQVSNIIEKGQSFAVADCICKKEKHMLDKGCEKPLEVCMGIAPVPGVFDNYHWGRAISKEEAYQVLEKAEEAGLVHLTWNMQDGNFFICNCCGCCCGVLRGINELGVDPGLVVNSHFYAVIDPEQCTACGVCADERCQVNAIEESDDAYRILPEKCIGCGLCISTCPSEAIELVRRPEDQCVMPPVNEADWYDERARIRGVDYSQYK